MLSPSTTLSRPVTFVASQLGVGVEVGRGVAVTDGVGVEVGFGVSVEVGVLERVAVSVAEASRVALGLQAALEATSDETTNSFINPLGCPSFIGHIISGCCQF